MSWYTPCRSVVRKMSELVHLSNRNHLESPEVDWYDERQSEKWRCIWILKMHCHFLSFQRPFFPASSEHSDLVGIKSFDAVVILERRKHENLTFRGQYRHFTIAMLFYFSIHITHRNTYLDKPKLNVRVTFILPYKIVK